MTKVDGKTLQKDIKQKLRARCAQIEKTIRLDLFYVGSDETIETYIALKKQFGEDIGVQVVGHTFSADTKRQGYGVAYKQSLAQKPLTGWCCSYRFQRR